ncbi:MAG: type II toxin-antitoxin system HigB family toxin [Chitinophagaceae bacterium]|nr:type II toxin-antitoxin system HigB family toxin [Chitinophagaceae bacterium]
MVVLTYKTIRAFLETNQYNETVTDAFKAWYKAMEKGDFANLNQLKATFPTVDYVGNQRYVFDIMGNHYRIVAAIHFKVRTVYILFLGTRKEYNKIDAQNINFKK